MKIKYSIVLPCYNEFKNLCLLIPQLLKIFKKKRYEIICVDDNSSDHTVPKLKKIFKKNNKIDFILRKKNRSLGLSIKDGIKKSTGNVIIVMDTDFNHRTQDLYKMVKQFEKNKFDMICGSRFLKGGSSNTFFRHVCSLVFNFFVNMITGGNLSDNLSGFFIIKKKFLQQKLDKIFYGYGDFYIRLLYFVQKKNLSILDFPVKYNLRRYGQSKSKLLRMLISYTYETIILKFKN